MMPLLYDDVRAKVNRAEGYADIRTKFAHAVVFDLNQVVPLFLDWQREVDRAISRTPPFDNLWAEWDRAGTQMFTKKPITARVGIWLQKLDDSVTEGIASLTPDGQQRRWAQCFGCLNFQRVDGAIMFSPDGALVFLNEDGTSWAYSPCPGQVEEIGFDDLFHIELMEIDPLVRADHHALWHIWPALMAFSLLHCKNVVTEDHVPSRLRQKDRDHAKLPRLITYKTLKIEVPKSAQARQQYDGEADDSSPKVRFHLCSGHFRELRSERFTEKRGQWVWVPAHFRGSKELGEVHSRRVLTAKKDE